MLLNKQYWLEKTPWVYNKYMWKVKCCNTNNCDWKGHPESKTIIRGKWNVAPQTILNGEDSLSMKQMLLKSKMLGNVQSKCCWYIKCCKTNNIDWKRRLESETNIRRKWIVALKTILNGKDTLSLKQIYVESEMLHYKQYRMGKTLWVPNKYCWKLNVASQTNWMGKTLWVRNKCCSKAKCCSTNNIEWRRHFE